MTIEELKYQMMELRAQYSELRAQYVDSTRNIAHELIKIHDRAYFMADNLHKMHEKVTALGSVDVYKEIP